MDSDDYDSSDDHDSDSELHGYSEEEDLDNIDRHLGENINEVEDNIHNNDNYINILQDNLDKLYINLTEDNLNITEFQKEITGIQQQIANIRVDSIQEYLSLGEMNKLKSELSEIFEKAKNLKFPKHVLDLSNFDQKKEKLSRFETDLREKVEIVVEKFKILNFQQNDMLKHVVKREIKDKIISTKDIRWFLERMPETLEEKNNVMSYFKNSILNLNKKKSIQIFGSYEETRNIYNSLTNPDFEKLQTFISELIGLVDSTFFILMKSVRDLKNKENIMLKNRILKQSKLKKEDILKDFDIIEGNISPNELETFMNDNNIDDPDIAENTLINKILSKYSKYLPSTKPNNIVQEFLQKKNGVIPVRNAPNIPDYQMVKRIKNDVMKISYIDELEAEDNINRYLNNVEENVMRENIKNNKRDLHKLKLILSKFPKQSLLDCINKMGYQIADPFIQDLRDNRISILKFRENPENFKDLAISINKSLDELHLSKHQKDLFKKSSKNIMIQINPDNKGKLHIPKGIISGDNINPEAVKMFFNNLEKYNSELVVNVGNTVYKDLIESQYTNLSEALKNTKVFGYFILTGKGLSQLANVVNDNDDSKFREKLISWKIKTETGNYGVSFQRLPINSKLRGSKLLVLDNKEYKIVIDQPPATNVYAWVVTDPLSELRIVVKDFEQYLEIFRSLLRSRLSDLKSESKIILIRKIKSINKYLNESNESTENEPSIIGSNIKEIQFRIIEKQKLIKKVLKYPTITDTNELIQFIGELERVAASCVNNVLIQKVSYIYRMEEIDYILRLYPNIIGLMAQGVLLPTDVINIRNNFPSILRNKLKSGYKLLNYDDLINWIPNTENIDDFPELKQRLVDESNKDIPNITLLDWNIVKNLNISLIQKKGIIQESYKYLKWAVSIKKTLAGKDRGVDKDRLTSFLNTSKFKLESISGLVNLQTRIKVNKKLELKVNECRELGFDVEDTENSILASRIEIVVFNLATNNLEYNKTVDNILKSGKKVVKKSDKNKKIVEYYKIIKNEFNFCELLTPDNTTLISEIAKKYIIMPEVFKGKSDQEVLANASIPVLNAIQSLQVNMIDIIDSRKNVRSDINKIGRRIALREIIVKQQIIKRKKETHAQEAVAIVNGKIDVKQIELINDQENKRLASKGFKLISTHNLEKWRINIYTPPYLSKTIPRNGYIIPLPKKIGFWVGGNFPDNPIPYRYVENGILQSHLTNLSSDIGTPTLITYNNNNVSQPITNDEKIALNKVLDRLQMGFNVYLTNNYSIQELENICYASGYELEFVTKDNDLLPWNLIGGDGDHIDLSIREYILKLEETDNIYIDVLESIPISELNRINKKFGTHLTPEETAGVWDLENIIIDYNKYFDLRDEAINPSLMYKRCIYDNLEVIKPLEIVEKYSKKEIQLMSIKDFKKYIIKKAKQNNQIQPSDSEIAKQYFIINNKEAIIVKSNKPYYLLNGKLYNVKHSASTSFPTPVEYSGQYPVYSDTQLNDLGNLLLSGMLSPWLINDINVVYGKIPKEIDEGSYVNISGKDSDGIKIFDKLGLVKKISDNIYYVEYSGGKILGEFTKSNLTPIIVKDVTGFTGNPPWFIKNQNVKLAMNYLKSSEFDDLDKPEQKKQLTLVIKEFNIFGEDLKVTKIISELNNQRVLLIKILKTILKTKMNKNQIIKIYDYLGFINPTVLRNKILYRHKILLDNWDYINSDKYRILSDIDRIDALQHVIIDMGINVGSIIKSKSYEISKLIQIEKDVIELISSSKNKINSALNHLNSSYWVDTNFKDKSVMYNDIAKALNIDDELINSETFLNKIKIRLNDVQKTIKYLRSKLFNSLGIEEETNILIRIVNDFNIQINIPTSKVIYNRLKVINLRMGLVSNYYIEQEFIDKYNKSIIVKTGVSKNKILWRSNDWDPCNHFNISEINGRLIDTINYIQSETFINNPNKNKILLEIRDNFGLKKEGKKGIIKELEDSIKEGGFTRCNGQFNCIWDNNKCVTPYSNVKPIETPEQRVQRLLESRNIENLPKIFVNKREFKEYKNEDVWDWYPFPKPKRSNKKEWDKWISDPEVKIWNLKIKDSLNELEYILFKRLRVNSKSFIERKDELTKELELFRKQMKSQKLVETPNIRKLKIKKELQLIPDKLYINQIMVENYLNIFLNSGVIRITNDAKKFLHNIENDKSLIGRIYTKFKIIKRDYGTKVVKLDNKKDYKYHNIQYIQVADKSINILDILKNMSYTHTLELDKFDNNMIANGYGILLDYLIKHSKISDSSSKDKINIPNKSVVIDVRDILDYMGDSYFQFGDYIFGVVSEEKNNDMEYSYIKPPCNYTTELNKNNSYITFDGDDYQGIYMIGDDLHQKYAISSDVARRFSLIVGSDIRYIPPCFSSKPSEKSGHKMTAITGEDVRSYFVRNGKGFYLSEMSIDDLKSNKTENLLYKQQSAQKELENKYKKALINIFKNKIPGNNLTNKVKNASRIFKIKQDVLGNIAILMEKENNLGKKAILEKLKIPVNRFDNTEIIKTKMKDIADKFINDYGFELTDYLKDPRTTKVDRIIEIREWKRGAFEPLRKARMPPPPPPPRPPPRMLPPPPPPPPYLFL